MLVSLRDEVLHLQVLHLLVASSFAHSFFRYDRTVGNFLQGTLFSFFGSIGKGYFLPVFLDLTAQEKTTVECDPI